MTSPEELPAKATLSEKVEDVATATPPGLEQPLEAKSLTEAPVEDQRELFGICKPAVSVSLRREPSKDPGENPPETTKSAQVEPVVPATVQAKSEESTAETVVTNPETSADSVTPAEPALLVAEPAEQVVTATQPVADLPEVSVVPLVTEPPVSPAILPHQALFDYLVKTVKLTEAVTLGDFNKFCMHSPNTNLLRWYGLYADMSDVYMTEMLAKDLNLPMLPPEKLIIMPKAADMFEKWRQGHETGWVPLFAVGAFLWVAHYDPFESFPDCMPAALMQRVLVTANMYDALTAHWREILVDLKGQAPDSVFPDLAEDRMEWLKHAGLSSHEVHQALTHLENGTVPFPLRDVSLSLVELGTPYSFWLQNRLFPYYKFQNTAFIGAPREADERELDRLRKQLEFKLSLTPIFLPVIKAELLSELKLFAPTEQTDLATTEEEFLPQEFLSTLLDAALDSKVSDVHLEPKGQEPFYRIRCRRDGVLSTYALLPMERAAAVLNCIKIAAGLDVVEKRQPRDGSFTHTCRGRKYDMRVSTIPQFDELECLVIRILDSRQVPSSLEELGFSTEDIHLVNQVLALDHGLMLVSGPTGSGKSTTLYAAIKTLSLDNYSLQTVEDPIEYKLERGAQYAVNKQLGLSYEKLLKHMLRADPDYILVGEIREAETAQVACVAANTGHLVLSTMHANDALSSLYRLRDMGVPMTLLLDVIKLIVSQRLLRKLCRKCRYKRAMTALERTVFIKHGYPLDCLDVPLYGSKGCHECSYQGYKGRFAILESLYFSNSLIEAVIRGDSRDTIHKDLVNKGFRSMYKNALAYVLRGETAFSELGSLEIAL